MATANMSDPGQLPPDEFLHLVKNAPLIAIDLIVENSTGEILVGRRTGLPAKGSWFVPGSRMRKEKTLDSAFARITLKELGIKIPRANSDFVGVFEHFYDDNFAGVPGVTTHYVVLAFRLRVPHIQISALPNSQHDQWQWMSIKNGTEKEGVHPNARPYFLASTRTSTEELVAL